MSKAKLLTALGLGSSAVIGHNLYRAHQEALEEAKKEFDPVETTLDGIEKYVLDPVGELTATQAAGGLAALTAAGVGGKYLYDRHRANNNE